MMINPVEVRCMTLAWQWCELNVGNYPDGLEGKPEDWDTMDKYEKHLILSSKQEEIIDKMSQIAQFINPHYILSYYWKCVYRKENMRMMPNTWIRWILFGTLQHPYCQEFNLSEDDEDEET